MMSSHQNDILLFLTWDGICHVPISGVSHRKALNPYAPPSSLDDLTSLYISKNLCVAGWIRTNGFLHVKQMYLPTIRQPHKATTREFYLAQRYHS